MKILRQTLFFLLLPMALMPLAAEQILLPENTPIFEKPDRFSRYIGSSAGPMQSAGKEFRISSTRHPLGWYSRCQPVKIGENQTGYALPDYVVRENQILFLPPPPAGRVLGAVICAVLALWVLWNRCRRETPLGEWEWLSLIVLLRQFSVFALSAYWTDILPSPADDPGYFEVTHDLLSGTCKGPWNFTIGNGLYYLPFALFLRAKTFVDIAVEVDFFTALIVGPAALAAGFFLLRRLGWEVRTAGAAILLWALWPFFAFHMENWQPEAVYPVLMPPPLAEAPLALWRFYAVCIGTGLNAMSDTPGLLALFLSLLCCCCNSKAPCNMLLSGAAFGAACLFRINYIFLAPFAAYLLLRQWNDAAWKRAPLLLGAGAAGFFALFGWQLAVNFHQFGSPLIFGYIRHYTDFAELDRPAAGFTLHTFLSGKSLRYLVGVQRPLWAAGLAGMICCADRRQRIALVLWALPLIFFFFGYSHTFCDARRFVFPAYAAMFGAAVLLVKNNRAAMLALAAVWIFGANFHLNFPGAGTVLRIAPGILAAAILLGAIMFTWKKEQQRTALFLLCFGLLFFLLPPWGYAAVLLLLLARCAVDLCGEIRAYFRSRV